MSNFSLKTGKFVGTASNLSWPQNHIFFPEDEKKLKQYGSLFVSFSLKAKTDELDLLSFGKEIISRFHEIYYSSLEEEVLKRLRKGIQQLLNEFSDRVEIEIVSGVVIEKQNQPVGYFSVFGTGRVLILRDDQITPILKGEAGTAKTASGYFQDGDLFLLATSQFFIIISEGMLKPALMNQEMDQVIEALAPIVHARDDNSQTAAIFFRVKVNEPEAVVAETPPEPVPAKEEKAETPTNQAERIILPRGNRMKNFLTTVVDLPGSVVKLAADFKRQPNIFIHDREKRERAKKTTLSVALILIFLLLVSLVLGSKRKLLLKESQQFQEVYKEAEYKYQQATTLVELNPLRARTLFAEANELIEKTISEIKNKTEKAKLEELLVKIKTDLETTAKEYRLEKAALFLDLSLVKEGFKGTSWAFSDNSLQVFDPDKAVILEVGIADKVAKVLAGGEKLVGADKIGATEERAFLLAGNKLLVVDKKRGEVIDEVEGKWQKAVGFRGFGGNAYLLDTKEQKIFKFNKTDKGLSPGVDWLGSGYNLEGAVSLGIDGSVWLLFSEGTIVKFTRGVKDAFLVTGLATGFNEPEIIYTDSDLDNLYILDRQNTRVVVISKDTGEYQAQYIWPGIAGAMDLFASEKEGKILLLTGERIYEIELRK